MKNILAFDTSTRYLSVALRAGARVFEATSDEGLKHSEKLLPRIDHLLKEAKLEVSDLDLVVCAVGPGSFTGLRIGLSTAKGLARGIGADFIGIPSLDGYAGLQKDWEGYVLPVIDARKGNFYAALFKDGIKIHPEWDLSAEEIMIILPKDYPVLITGPDCRLFSSFVGDRVKIDDSFDGVCAPVFLDLGLKRRESQGAGDSFDMGALYIRKSEAEEKLLLKTENNRKEKNGKTTKDWNFE